MLSRIRYLNLKANFLNFSRRSFADDVQNKFTSAVSSVSKLRNEPDNEMKLKLYALYKQSTVGECNAPKPGMMDIVGKYKWQAWKDLGSLDKSEAMSQYISIVNKLYEQEGGNQSTQADANVSLSSDLGDSLIVTNKENILTVKINRPKKLNSITLDMYRAITRLLNESANNENVKMVVITGSGSDYFSSGNDLSKYTKISSKDEMVKQAEEGKHVLIEFIDSFINFPKPLIGAVNGHAFGIMVTTLALYDVVICSDQATFQTPFSSTAQSPEGCSSYTFPEIFGYSKANMMLMFNYKMSAQEALQTGFVAKVLPSATFESDLNDLLYGENSMLKNCAQGSIMATKALIRTEKMKQKLREVNKAEVDVLVERWFSPEFLNFIMKFFSRK